MEECVNIQNKYEEINQIGSGKFSPLYTLTFNMCSLITIFCKSLLKTNGFCKYIYILYNNLPYIKREILIIFLLMHYRSLWHCI